MNTPQHAVHSHPIQDHPHLPSVRTILVPLDGSFRARDAVSVAQALAARFQSDITLIQVAAGTCSSDAVDTATRDLGEVAARLRALGFAVSTVLQTGPVFSCIATVAEVEQADLIVLAPHHETGISSLRDLFLPRVSYRLTSRGPVPVLIVPPHAYLERTVGFLSSPMAMEHPIVIALDGAAQSEQVVPLATELARALNQRALLVRVVPESMSSVPATRSDDPRYIDLDDRHLHQVLRDEREAHRYVAAVRRSIVATTPIKVQTRVIVGDPAHRLLQLAVDVDAGMLALVSHGSGGVAAALWGSVTQTLLRQSQVPLLIVPSVDRAEGKRSSGPLTGEALPKISKK